MKAIKVLISIVIAITMFVAPATNYIAQASTISSENSVTDPEDNLETESAEDVTTAEQDSEDVTEEESSLDSSDEIISEETIVIEEDDSLGSLETSETEAISSEESLNESSTDSLNNEGSADAPQARTAASPTISYRTHVQNDGWQSYTADGITSGTTGQAKRLEGIQINLDSPISGGIQYRTHVQNDGWHDWVSDGTLSGTTGESKRLEAIQVQLTGEMANQYDVYYRVHAQNFGWLDWAKNGESAGTSGYSYRTEAVQVVLVKKGEAAPGSTATPFKQSPTNVSYSTHIQNIGWQSSQKNGATSGVTGQAKRLEAIKINLSNKEYSGSIQYRTHVQNDGWQDWAADGALSGTSGQAKRLEAIQIKLTGEMANQYDVYYRVHAENFGWLGWAKNGESAGTSGYAYRAEAIQVVLVKKGGAAPGSTATPFQQKSTQKMPTIFIDPGHGGNDPGAVYGNYRESDIALSVSKMLNTLITNRSGMNTKMTRTENSAQGITTGSGVSSTGESLTKRTDFAKANKQTDDDVFVSIHVNSFTDSSAQGAETFYYGLSSGRSTDNTNPYVEESKQLAQFIQKRIVSMVGMKDRSSKHGDLGVLRTNGMPAVLTELGFISNSSDRAKLVDNSYQQKFAEAIYQGILDYYEANGFSVNAWR